MTIGLCIIAKNEEGNIGKVIGSAKKYVDSIYVTDTGSTDKTVSVAEKAGAIVSRYQWADDFGSARAFNFSQSNDDWILWLDCDDILKEGEKIRTLVEQADSNNIKGYFLPYNYEINQKTGEVELEHWKLRLVKNDGHFEWKGKIHEDILQRHEVRWVRTRDVYVNHYTNADRRSDSLVRNVRILQSELGKQLDSPDPRLLYYLAIALKSSEQYDDSLVIFYEYLRRSGWDEERYQARLNVGQIYSIKKEYEKASASYLAAIQDIPSYPDAYFSMANMYFEQEDWKKVIEWCRVGFSKKKPETNLITFPQEMTWRPLALYAYACMHVGELDEAVKMIKAANQITRSQDTLAEVTNTIFETFKNKEIAKSFVNITKLLKERSQEEKILPLLSGVPNELKDNPMILKVLWDYSKPKEWGEDEIAIYCPMTVESWSPKSLDSGGIGGSETAVVQLSKRLQQHGWKVTVFNWCSIDAGEYDGVIYKNFWEFNWTDSYSKLILWRFPDLLDLDIKAKEIYIDLHDVPNPHSFNEKRVRKIKKIFVKSNYHRSLLPMIDDEKFAIVGNGIDLDRFDGIEKRDDYALIYSSTPDRGLDILVDLFPKIKKAIPQATLHVFYGWNTFHKIEKNNPERMRWMGEVQKKLKQDGIIEHGRLPQNELAMWQQRCSIWVYPTYFAEIHCITAQEMQAAGVIPITTDYAALRETVKVGIKVPGDIYRKEIQDVWVKEVIGLLRDKPRAEKMREEMKVAVTQEFTWDYVGDIWDKELRT